MTQTLRVLNAARYYEIGIPITLEQYRQNSPEVFLSRLILRSHHLLALRIADFLKLSNAPVLRHWASVKVLEAKGANEDDKICQLLVDRFEEPDGGRSGGCSAVSVGDRPDGLGNQSMLHFHFLTSFKSEKFLAIGP